MPNKTDYLKLFLFGLLWSYAIGVTAQKLKAKKGSFGVDELNRIIVWHTDSIKTASFAKRRIKKLVFDKPYKVLDTIHSLSFNQRISVDRKGKVFSLFITKFPLVHLTVDTMLNENTKVLGRYTYFNKNRLIRNGVGLEYRGNLSLTYPKKTYDLEFWKDSVIDDSKDLSFKNLRKDDDWILDGLYNEPLRIRSNFAMDLWVSIHKPFYQELEPSAKSGVEAVFVEVFRNKRYQGIFSLSESVDRKLLGLRKNDVNSIKGELFKASSYEGAPAFKKSPKYNNLFPHWGGFEMIFPVIDYESHWQNLAELVDLVVNGTDDEFTNQIGTKVDIANVIDYFLFVNLLRATDNLGKNYYLARYKKEGTYFFVPWDLDGVMGIIQDGKRIPTTNDILSNGLFDRLLLLNPNGYRAQLKTRWSNLRKKEFNNKTLLRALNMQYTKLREEKVYEREYMIWPNERPLEHEFEYLTSWLKKRLFFLDTHFGEL